jgi:hypothetical protein
MRPFATLPAVLALLAAACSDVATISPEPEPSPRGFHTELTCTASVREGRVSCGDDAPEGGSGAFPRLIVGGQNVYVRLASSGAAYNPADSIFRVDVTVQNLMTQAFGTSDGTTDTGLRVFFHSGPDVTGGTGSVSVDNEDGSDIFLTAVTPYFGYGGVLYTNDVSEAKTWRFKVDPQVETFNFKVLVQGQLPHEGSLLRFRREYGPTLYYPIYGIWGPSASEVFAVGEDMLLRYTGGAWVRDTTPYWNLVDVWGTSASDVYAVGEYTIVHWNGTEWSRVSTDHLCILKEDEEGSYFLCPFFYGVWGSGPDDVWVVGETGDDGETSGHGGLILHYDGEGWSAETLIDPLRGVWGSAANDVWAVSGRSIYHYDGTAWTIGGPSAILFGVWGLSSTNVYAPYWDHTGNYPSEHGVMHYDGVEWRPMPGLPDDVYCCWYKDVWGTAPDNLFVAGLEKKSRDPWGRSVGIIMHWDGSTWAEMKRDSSGSWDEMVGFGTVSELWGFGPNDVLANIDGGISRGTR